MTNPDYSDDQLLAMLAAGDQRAITYLFNKYHAYLFERVVRFVHSEEDADDIVQKLFIDVWSKQDSLVISKPIIRYLTKSALNRARNALRDKGRRNQVSLDNATSGPASLLSLSDAPDANLMAGDIRKLVAEARQRMSTPVRFTFILSRQHHKSNAEIADFLGITVKGVEKNITTALRILREVFGNHDDLFLLLMVLILIKK